jgi:acyl-coenzyme A synthetase/AMP-(fatty) acid ligase
VRAIEVHAGTIGDRPAIRHRECVVTFSQFEEDVRSARSHIEASLEKGSVVSIATADSNWVSWATAYAAVVTSGRVALLVKQTDTPSVTPTLTARYEGGFAISLSLERDPLSASLYRDALGEVGLPLDIVFTSGTSGLPQPYAFDHRHFSRPAGIISPKQPIAALHTGIPFGTSTGAHAIFIRHLLNGWLSIAVDPPGSWQRLTQLLSVHRPMELSSTPFSLRRLLSSPGEAIDLVRTLRVYAGDLSDEIRSELERRLVRCRIVSIYGLTEAANAVMVRHRPGRRFDAAAGQTFRVWSIENKHWAVEGELGEILVKHDAIGAPIPIGQAKPLPHQEPRGWTRTGDLGRLRDAGSIELWGRANEVVEIASRRQNAAELESAVCEQVESASAALVFSFFDGQSAVLGIVVESDTAADELARSNYLSQLPASIALFVVAEIPRTGLGKIARSAGALAAQRIMHDLTPVSFVRPNGLPINTYDSRRRGVLPS